MAENAEDVEDTDFDLSWIFTIEMHNFWSLYCYVLVVSPGITKASLGNPAVLLPFSRIPWRAIIDLDPLSDTDDGFCHVLQNALLKELDTPVIKLTHSDVTRSDFKLESSGIPWLFARGMEGKPKSLCRTYREYNEFGEGQAGVKKILEAMTDGFEYVFLMMIFDDSNDVIRIFEDITCNIGSTLGSYASIVTVCGENVQMSLVSRALKLQEPVQFDTLKIFSHIDYAVTKQFGPSREKKGYIVMGRQPISPELSATISIEWELVHQGIELIPRDESETTMNFYMGRREISWSDLHQQADINRTIYERIKRNVEKNLKAGKHTFTNIEHDPGAGGTTLARRLAYDLHEKYPCLILKADQNLDNIPQTCETLKKLFSADSGRSLLLIVHVDQEKINALDYALRCADVTFVIIRVGHSQPNHSSFLTEDTEEFKLSNVLDYSEAMRFYRMFRSMKVPGSKKVKKRTSDDNKEDRQGLKDPFMEQYGYNEREFKEKYTEEKELNNQSIVNNMVMFTPTYFAVTKFQEKFLGMRYF